MGSFARICVRLGVSKCFLAKRLHPRILTSRSCASDKNGVGRSSLASEDFFQRVLQRFPPGSSKRGGHWPLAFAYGSGVFHQIGNLSTDNMTDFIMVVENSEEWHRQNLAANPTDYAHVMWFLGARLIGQLQDKFGSKMFFNTLIPFEDGEIKYGVISRESLVADLLDWENLYSAGRLHKPVRIIEKASRSDDAELNLGLRMNLKNALHTALLLLPERFTEQRLFYTLCSLSYTGDFRMAFGEDKNKVEKLAKGSFDELRSLYSDQLSKLSEFIACTSHVEFDGGSMKRYEQDTSPGGRHFHLTMLPKNMQELLVAEWNKDGRWRDVEDVLRSAAYDRNCDELITTCLGYVVSRPALVQAAKGVITAGPIKTIRYSHRKVKKMLKSKNEGRPKF